MSAKANLKKKYAALTCASSGTIEMEVADLRTLLQMAGIEAEQPQPINYISEDVHFAANSTEVAKHCMYLAVDLHTTFAPAHNVRETYIAWPMDKKSVKANKVAIREALASFQAIDESSFIAQNLVTNAKELAKSL
jgi:hypothetical protein